MSVFNQNLQVPGSTADGKFDPVHHPLAVSELAVIRAATGSMLSRRSEIIISFLKMHRIKREWIEANPALTEMITRGRLKTVHIESLFEVFAKNKNFLVGFEGYIKEWLAPLSIHEMGMKDRVHNRPAITTDQGKE
jgi:hypothetical protein